MSTPLARLHDAVRESGTPLAATLAEAPDSGDGPDRAVRAGAGPRAAANRDAIEVAVAAVDEGYQLHYGRPRALRIDSDDLTLLAGDRMYALGLARLAAIGDMTAIAELADVISLGAQAHASQDPQLADAAWEAGVAAIAAGTTAQISAAKRRARTGDRAATQALREAARHHPGRT